MDNLIENFPRIANTVAELMRISGLKDAYEILSNSERRIELTGHDSWNGGMDTYTVYLQTSIDVFSKNEANLSRIEEAIKVKFNHLLRNYPSDIISNIIITPRLLSAEGLRVDPKVSIEKYAFISYQTKDKSVAGNIKQLLGGVGIKAFLAHEDIEVSLEWREEILKEISSASIFICLLSQNYLLSPWCLQEAGMAILRGITIIPLSIDGTIPMAFMSKYQATRINIERPMIRDLMPGLLKYNKFDGLNIMIELLGASGSFRTAEANFELLLPYINDLTEIQVKELFKRIRENGQVHHAALCASQYIPQLLRQYGSLISKDDFNFLKEVCAQYNGII
jgi:hypothetical protein